MAGLCGATLRVVNTFMVAICGTHMHTSMNSFLGIFPMIVLAYVLNDPDCTYRTLAYSCYMQCYIQQSAKPVVFLWRL